MKTLTYPSGRIVTYTPDSAGRLVSAVDSNGTNYVTSAAYNASSSLASLINGNSTSFAGITNTFLYNPRLQVCRITAYSSGSVPSSCIDSANHGNLMDRGYNYNLGAGDNGNVMAITNYRDTTRSQSFIYDPLNRLTSGWSAASTGAMSWGETYSIDPWGNLMIAPMVNKANGGNFQHAGDIQNRAAGLGYDAAGNMTNYTAPGQYVYDPENRILSTGGMSYTYDADGERVLKSNTSTGAAVKRYWTGAGNIVAEGDGSGALTAEYIYFGGKRVARIDLPANSVHYYLSDHLSSTSVVTSAAGAIEEESDYYPFGTEVVVSSTGANKYKFSGKERDTESNLDQMGARFYSNAMGRFSSIDPLQIMKQKLNDPQQWSMYQYARDNPLRYSDPTGMYTTSCTQSDVSKCDKNTQNFEKARQEGLKSKDSKVRDAANAYGAYGEKNKVRVGFSSKEKSHVGFSFDANGKFSAISVTINTNRLSGIEKAPGTAESVQAIANVAHEGSHVETDRTLAEHNFSIMFNITNRESEIRAYAVSNSVFTSAGFAYADDSDKPIDLSTVEKIGKFVDAIPPNPKEKMDGRIYQPPK